MCIALMGIYQTAVERLPSQELTSLPRYLHLSIKEGKSKEEQVCQPWEVHCITLNLEHARRVFKTNSRSTQHH